MIEDKQTRLTKDEVQHAKDIYSKYGNDPEALSQAVWKDLQKLGSKSELNCQVQMRKEIENSFFEQLSKEGHDHHKKVYIEFNEPYHHDKKNVEIGTSRGVFKDGHLSDMKSLESLKPVVFSKEATDLGNRIYDKLGPAHNNLSEIQHSFNDSTSWTCADEKSKTARDHGMQAFVQKANSDKSCPFKFELVSNDAHALGFIAKDKHTGKVVQEIKLHDDRY